MIRASSDITQRLLPAKIQCLPSHVLLVTVRVCMRRTRAVNAVLCFTLLARTRSDPLPIVHIEQVEGLLLDLVKYRDVRECSSALNDFQQLLVNGLRSGELHRGLSCR